jgi:hypothetical protein
MKEALLRRNTNTGSGRAIIVYTGITGILIFNFKKY